MLVGVLPHVKINKCLLLLSHDLDAFYGSFCYGLVTCGHGDFMKHDVIHSTEANHASSLGSKLSQFCKKTSCRNLVN